MHTCLCAQTSTKNNSIYIFLQRRSALEQHSHTLEVEIESLKTQLDEESEARMDLERQLSKANGEAATWKSKYEAECQSHADEVDELRLISIYHVILGVPENEIEDNLYKN